MKTIVMLEHDDDDRYITQTVFDENNYPIKLQFVTSSDDLFNYLKECEHGRNKIPSLILLNYYAVPDNAVDIIRRLKQNERFRYIPTVVLSGVVKDELIKECYAVGASSFIQKPDNSDDTNEKIDTFVKYWFKIVALPS